MYECKKLGAQKTIEKKEAKLKEIQTVCQKLTLIFNQFISVRPGKLLQCQLKIKKPFFFLIFFSSFFTLKILDEEITPTMNKLQEVGSLQNQYVTHVALSRKQYVFMNTISFFFPTLPPSAGAIIILGVPEAHA